LDSRPPGKKARQDFERGVIISNKEKGEHRRGKFQESTPLGKTPYGDNAVNEKARRVPRSRNFLKRKQGGVGAPGDRV